MGGESVAGVVVAWAAILSGSLLLVVRPPVRVLRWLLPAVLGLLLVASLLVWVSVFLELWGW